MLPPLRHSLSVVCIHQVVSLGIVSDDPSDLTALKGAPLPRREREVTRLVSSSWTWGPTANIQSPCLAGVLLGSCLPFLLSLREASRAT